MSPVPTPVPAKARASQPLGTHAMRRAPSAWNPGPMAITEPWLIVLKRGAMKVMTAMDVALNAAKWRLAR